MGFPIQLCYDDFDRYGARLYMKLTQNPQHRQMGSILRSLTAMKPMKETHPLHALSRELSASPTCLLPTNWMSSANAESTCTSEEYYYNMSFLTHCSDNACRELCKINSMMLWRYGYVYLDLVYELYEYENNRKNWVDQGPRKVIEWLLCNEKM